jgi:hypothetical protein
MRIAVPAVRAKLDIRPPAARDCRRVARAVSQWRAEATRLGISSAECTRMESAFAHADLATAR